MTALPLFDQLNLFSAFHLSSKILTLAKDFLTTWTTDTPTCRQCVPDYFDETIHQLIQFLSIGHTQLLQYWSGTLKNRSDLTTHIGCLIYDYLPRTHGHVLIFERRIMSIDVVQPTCLQTIRLAQSSTKHISTTRIPFRTPTTTMKTLPFKHTFISNERFLICAWTNLKAKQIGIHRYDLLDPSFPCESTTLSSITSRAVPQIFIHQQTLFWISFDSKKKSIELRTINFVRMRISQETIHLADVAVCVRLTVVPFHRGSRQLYLISYQGASASVHGIVFDPCASVVVSNSKEVLELPCTEVFDTKNTVFVVNGGFFRFSWDMLVIEWVCLCESNLGNGRRRMLDHEWRTGGTNVGVFQYDGNIFCIVWNWKVSDDGADERVDREYCVLGCEVEGFVKECTQALEEERPVRLDWKKVDGVTLPVALRAEFLFV